MFIAALADELIFPPDVLDYPPRRSFTADMSDEEKDETIDFFKVAGILSNNFWIHTEEKLKQHDKEEILVDTHAIKPTSTFGSLGWTHRFFQDSWASNIQVAKGWRRWEEQ